MSDYLTAQTEARYGEAMDQIATLLVAQQRMTQRINVDKVEAFLASHVACCVDKHAPRQLAEALVGWLTNGGLLDPVDRPPC